MVYDLNAQMKREGEQQRLIETICSNLYRAAEEKDIDVDTLYRKAAMYLLECIGENYPNTDGEWELDYQTLVLSPIDAFASGPTERMVLISRTFQKMAAGIGFSIESLYQSHLIRTYLGA